MKESVLVVPTAGINPLLTGCFTTANLERCLQYILSAHTFRERDLVEEDPSFKQIIPYVLVRHDGRYLLMRRTKKQTESRLHDKFSLGIGGHINTEEKFGDGQNVIEAGLERELDEEVHVKGQRRSLELAAIISDDTTPVGQVHLGLIYILEPDRPDFEVREADMMTAEWAPLSVLQSRREAMETWSQIAFDNIISKDPTVRPA